jgi:hypothetical protein
MKLNYTWLTVLGVALLGGSFGMNMIFLTTAGGSERIGYQVGSAIINAAVVSYLAFNLIFYRPYYHQWQMILAISLLIIGLTIEIYFTSVPLTPVTTGLAYTLAVLNAFARLYILIGVRCASAQSSIPGLVGEVVKAVQPVVEASKSVGKDLGTIDLQNIYSRVVQSPGILKWLNSLPQEEKDEQKTSIKQSIGLEPKPPRERDREGGRR